ncbi:hypothetical protein [Lentisalinibacter salinarum]|uniref:hypothetical protein n=1 Tax=Lentisalinibacter salinarum TaxID=2992239 RepID=UPI0038705F0E
MTGLFLGSLTRIADLDVEPFAIERLPHTAWAGGDYVVGAVTGTPGPLYEIETATGRHVRVLPGDLVVGAFGNREATLEGVGSWRDIEGDEMHAMTGAGLFGRFVSLSLMLPQPLTLEYRGHVLRDGRKLAMGDFVEPAEPQSLECPVVLLYGTSMSAGKTTAGRVIVHELSNVGLDVVGVKLTGAGRYRDVLSFQDAGADAVFDFVDAGLPSTVVPEDVFLTAIRPLLGRIARRRPDVVVVEAGASPLEPYNGAAAITELGERIRCAVLCASDPYAVTGVEHAFGLRPDVVMGPATSTSAAIALVRKLSGVPAINVLNPGSLPALRRVLAECLGIRFR